MNVRKDQKFRFSSSLSSRLRAYGYKPNCARCGEPFKDGDLVIRKLRTCGFKNKYYHVKCWESMFI